MSAELPISSSLPLKSDVKGHPSNTLVALAIVLAPVVPCNKAIAVAAFDPYIKNTVGPSAVTSGIIASLRLDLPNLPESDLAAAAEDIAYLYWGVRQNSSRSADLASIIVARYSLSITSLNDEGFHH